MPWRLPGDLAHFRAVTMGKPVIMGRRTFEAIGRPLAGRHVVVLSRDSGRAFPDAEAARTIEEAVERAGLAPRRAGVREIMVAGGATVYAAFMSQAQTLLVTEVDLEPEGDARFPAIDPAAWMLEERRPAAPWPQDEASYAFARYRRRGGGAMDTWPE